MNWLLLMLVGACTSEPSPTSSPGIPATPDATPEDSATNLVIISLDTVSAEHMKLYGGPAATPNISAVARKGALFVLHDTLEVPDCKRVFDELTTDEDFELVRNFDRRFGISVWRYLAVRGPDKSWWSRLFGA